MPLCNKTCLFGGGISFLCVGVSLCFYGAILPALLGSESTGSAAESWYSAPKQTENLTVIDRGIQYMGSCLPLRRTYVPAEDMRNRSFQHCEVNGSGEKCEIEAKNLYDAVTMQGNLRPDRRLFRGGAGRNCVDAYQVWLKVEVPGMGQRCAYRFGIADISVMHNSGNADLAAKLYNEYPVGKRATFWSLDSDNNFCVMGFSSLAHYVVLDSYYRASSKRVWLGFGFFSIAVSLLFFAFAACEVASPGTADQLCYPPE